MLRLLRGETTAAEASTVHGLPESQIHDWTRRFLSGAERALRHERVSRRLRATLVALAGLWLILRLAYWNGYYIEDAPGYVTDAIYFAIGSYHPRDYVTGLNVGTYLPVSLPLRLFGKSEVALSLWPLLCSLLGVASMTGAAAILFGRRLGLLAGLLYVTYPGDIFFSTVVMPDAIQAGWLTFSVCLAVLAASGRSSRRYWTLAAAGIAMGVCHLIRANGPILLPIGLAAAALLARGAGNRVTASVVLQSVGVYLAGWLLVQAVEGLVYFWAVGDFFHRYNVVNRHYGTLQSIGQWGLNTDPTTIPYSVFPPLLWARRGGWGTLNQDQAYHGFLFLLAAASVCAGFLTLRIGGRHAHDRTVAGFALGVFWFAWPLLYHQFGSQSLTEFVPMHRLSRHLVVYAPGAMFATVAGLLFLARRIARWPAAARRAMTATGLVLLSGHLYFNWQGERLAFEAFHRIKDTYTRIRGRLPADVRTIVGDPGDLCFFEFWLNPLGVEHVRTMPFANYSRCEQIDSGIVLTRSNPGWDGFSAAVIAETVQRLPCLIDPPPNWRLLYDGFPEKVFVVEPVRDEGR